MPNIHGKQSLFFITYSPFGLLFQFGDKVVTEIFEVAHICEGSEKMRKVTQSDFQAVFWRLICIVKYAKEAVAESTHLTH